MKRTVSLIAAIITGFMAGCAHPPDRVSDFSPESRVQISLYFEMPAVDHGDPWYSGYAPRSPHYSAHFSSGEWTTASDVMWDGENQRIAMTPGNRSVLICKMVEVRTHDSAADDSCTWTLVVFFGAQRPGTPEEIFLVVHTGDPPASFMKTNKIRELRQFWPSSAFDSGFDVSATFDGSNECNAPPCEVRLVGRMEHRN